MLVTRRRRPTRETVPAPTPTIAELAAEAHDRLATAQQDLRVAPPPRVAVPASLCGWCQGRDGLRAIREHKPCGQRSCQCACNDAASYDRPLTEIINPPLGRLLCIAEPLDEDPRDGSGVRDAISQSPGMESVALGMDPELAALLGSEETP